MNTRNKSGKKRFQRKLWAIEYNDNIYTTDNIQIVWRRIIMICKVYTFDEIFFTKPTLRSCVLVVFDEHKIFTKSIFWRSDDAMFQCFVASHRCVGETTTTATTTIIVQRNNKINTAKFLLQKIWGDCGMASSEPKKSHVRVCLYACVVVCVC